MSEEELKQMSGDELIGIIKAQRFEIKEKNLLIQELRDTIDNQKEEIDRLNNIIDKLEKWLDKEEKLTFNSWNKGIHEVQRKLQDLKELKENK